MIRGLLVLLGLALGLTAAGLGYGRMAHLRALTAPPAWTAAVSDDAGLLSGRAETAGIALGWRLVDIDAQGPLWALRLDAPGAALTAWGRLARGGLAIALPEGAAVLTGSDLAGRLTVQGGEGRLDAEGLRLDLFGQADRLMVAGQPRPDGPARLRLAADGRWSLTLPGPDGTQTLEGAHPADLLAP